MDSFLPSEYEMPKGGGGYTKLMDGSNKLRILTKPLLGWIDWDKRGDKPQPMRSPYNGPDSKPSPLGKDRVKHFWAVVVYNYDTKSVEIFEITQASIQKEIKQLAGDEDWGDPSGYAIKINRSGSNLDTEYSVQPSPKSDIEPEAVAAFKEKPVDLSKLLTGEDPFEVEAEAAQEKPKGETEFAWDKENH